MILPAASIGYNKEQWRCPATRTKVADIERITLEQPVSAERFIRPNVPHLRACGLPVSGSAGSGLA